MGDNCLEAAGPEAGDRRSGNWRPSPHPAYRPEQSSSRGQYDVRYKLACGDPTNHVYYGEVHILLVT